MKKGITCVVRNEHEFFGSHCSRKFLSIGILLRALILGNGCVLSAVEFWVSRSSGQRSESWQYPDP